VEAVLEAGVPAPSAVREAEVPAASAAVREVEAVRLLARHPARDPIADRRRFGR
jgi:hypothetical protein